MFSYIVKNMYRHKLRLVLTFILLVASVILVSFSLQVLLNFSNMINSSWTSPSMKEDLESVTNLILMFMAILIGFSYVMINNTYSVILHGRIQEFTLLNRLGMYRTRIKRMLYIEIVMLGTVSVIIGATLGTVLSYWYMHKYNMQSKVIYSEVIVYILALTIPMLIFIIHKNLKQLPIGILQLTTTSKKIQKQNNTVQYVKANEMIKKWIWLIVGVAVIIYSFTGLGKLISTVFNLNLETQAIQNINDISFWVGVFIALGPTILIILKILEVWAKSSKLTTLHLAVQQNLYTFRKIKTLTVSFMFSTLLIVGMLGFYHSAKSSVANFAEDHIHYSHVIVSNQPITKSEGELKGYVDTEWKGRSVETALTIEANNEKDKYLLVTGINPTYFNIEELSYINSGNELEIFKKKEFLPIIFSANRAADKGFNIGDELEYNVGNRKLTVKIEETYRPLNLLQGYVSRQSLSQLLYGQDDIYNTVYLIGGTDKDAEQISSFLGIKNASISNMGDLKREYKSQAIKGTEMIEAFLYINLLFTTSLIINMFLLSLQDRTKQFAMLRIVGVSKLKLVGSMCIEGLLIFLLGSFLGWELGVEFIKGAVMYMNDSISVPMETHVPVLNLSATLAVCFLALFVSTVIIGYSALRKNALEYMYKE